MSINHFLKYKKNNTETMDIYQVITLIIDKIQSNIHKAMDAVHLNDDLTRVKACAEAAFQLSLIVDAVQSDVFEENPQLSVIKNSCVLFVEFLFRANIQKSLPKFERLSHEISVFKKKWILSRPFKKSMSDPYNCSVAVCI